MQSALSRIWTCVAVSISNDDNHYTKSMYIYNFCLVWFGFISTIVDYPYLSTPLLRQDMTQGQFLSGVVQDLNLYRRDHFQRR